MRPKTIYSENPVCVLINSAYYFFDYVIIIKQENGSRLVVAHNNKRVVDLVYQTSKGACIAFSRIFKKKAMYYKIKVKPEWTGFYNPEQAFLDRITQYPLSEEKTVNNPVKGVPVEK